MNNLDRIGFSDWFRDKLVQDSPFNPARIIEVNKNNYIVSTGTDEIIAELSGKFIFNAASSEDYPAVGDWVYIELFDNDSFAVIHELMPRKSLLKRKNPGKKIEFQLIVSNIDSALIMQSLDSDFNIRRLERYLVISNDSGIEPVILLSKADLVSKEEAENRIKEISELMPDLRIYSFSSNTESDVEKIKELLNAERTYCLLGSSGVGKSTLLNKLLSDDIIKTKEVRSKTGKGKHTTTRREMHILDNGAIIIDTPGMRELGIMGTETAIGETFPEITVLAERCRFKDCTHTIEKGCAILKALEEGEISQERYQNYKKIYKESLYYNMSYIEKRQKDKKFGKFIHNYLKEKKDKE
jgi:ribosome biogenesis GTPase / thiamine phosphate phosphatase